MQTQKVYSFAKRESGQGFLCFSKGRNEAQDCGQLHLIWTISYNDLTFIVYTFCVKAHMFHFTPEGNNLNRKLQHPNKILLLQ